MAFASSRLAIGQALQAFLSTVQNPNTSQNLYGVARLGAVWNPSLAGISSNWIEVVHHKGVSGPAGSGGNQIGWRIEDSIVWRLGSGFVYEPDSGAAQVAMLTAMDILLPILHSHYTLPQAGNTSVAVASVYSVLEDPADDSKPTIYPDGHVYLLWNCYVVTKQQYNISIVSP